MSYEDQVLALFGEANPISKHDTLENFLRPRLEIVEQRTGNMTEQEVRDIDPTRPIVRKERRRGPVYGLAAAVVVLIIGTVSWIAFRDDGGSGFAATPVDIGRSFIQAQDAWDADAALALLAPDAVIDQGLFTNIEEYPSHFEWNRALDWNFAVEECNQTVNDAVVEVTCAYSYENAWTRALGVGPYSGSTFDFVIADGQIQELTDNFESSTGFSTQAWEVFRGWVRDTHPEAVSVMYDFSGPSDAPRVTSEALVLWEQYTNEFVTSVTDSGTP